MRKFLISLSLLLLFTGAELRSQDLLSRNMTVNAANKRLDKVLEQLSNSGRFYFSYSSSIVKKDSIVTINVEGKSLKDILGQLLGSGYEFVQNGNYIIIRRAPVRLTMITNKAVKEDKIYAVTGFVYDEQTGLAIRDASVYEKDLLAATLTNQDGYFKLKLKSGKKSTAELTLSKEFYADTSVIIEPRHNQELTITMMPLENEAERTVVSPEDYELVEPVVSTQKEEPAVAAPVVALHDSNKVETTGPARFLLSARQKVQSLNLKKFFTTRPYQASLVPGLGSHGKMSGQVVNNISLNLLGGYTAGTNWVEIGGLFNIDKKSVQFAQAAGLFNIVGGKMTGFQVAGISNTVLDSVTGVQAAGISNLVKGRVTGFQIAGIYNHVTDSIRGMQTAGIANFARRKVSGVQVAGIANMSNKETDGAQIAGIINYSKRLKGIQIGLINISDTSDGYSIGLINIVFKGYHKLSFFTNEITNVNAAFKTGNSKLYSILTAGLRSDDTQKAYTFGYGLGTEMSMNSKRSVTLNPELYSQYRYLGSWDYTNIISRLQLNLNVKLGRFISIFAGPSVSLDISDQSITFKGYASPGAPSGYKYFRINNRTIGWLGWNAGINFF